MPVECFDTDLLFGLGYETPSDNSWIMRSLSLLIYSSPTRSLHCDCVEHSNSYTFVYYDVKKHHYLFRLEDSECCNHLLSSPTSSGQPPEFEDVKYRRDSTRNLLRHQQSTHYDVWNLERMPFVFSICAFTAYLSWCVMCVCDQCAEKARKMSEGRREHVDIWMLFRSHNFSHAIVRSNQPLSKHKLYNGILYVHSLYIGDQGQSS